MTLQSAKQRQGPLEQREEMKFKRRDREAEEAGGDGGGRCSQRMPVETGGSGEGRWR